MNIPILLRREKVLEVTGLTSEELERDMREGVFPTPVKLSPLGDAVGWPDNELRILAFQRIAGAGADDLRALVSQTVALRKTLPKGPAPRPITMIAQRVN